MNDIMYYSQLDRHPFTGERNVSFKAKVSEKSFLRGHFNGNPKCEQVENVIQGNVYDIYKVVGYGDGADFYFLDDKGEEQSLGSFFFDVADS